MPSGRYQTDGCKESGGRTVGRRGGAQESPTPPIPPQFDINGDGRISFGELRVALKGLLGERLTQRETDEILRDMDLNGDGLVDFEGTETPPSIWTLRRFGGGSGALSGRVRFWGDRG